MNNAISKELVNRQLYEQNLVRFAPPSLVRMINRKLTERQFTVISTRKWGFFTQTYIKLELTSSGNFWGFTKHNNLSTGLSEKVIIPKAKICESLENSGLSDYNIFIDSYNVVACGCENSGRVFNEYKLVLLLKPKT